MTIFFLKDGNGKSCFQSFFHSFFASLLILRFLLICNRMKKIFLGQFRDPKGLKKLGWDFLRPHQLNDRTWRSIFKDIGKKNNCRNLGERKNPKELHADSKKTNGRNKAKKISAEKTRNILDKENLWRQNTTKNFFLKKIRENIPLKNSPYILKHVRFLVWSIFLIFSFLLPLSFLLAWGILSMTLLISLEIFKLQGP